MTAAARIPAADIDQFILDEAADWLVLFQSGEATDGDRARLARWRARSAAHEAAWQKAEGVLATFRQVPSRLGRDTLARAHPGRRQALRLGLLALAMPAAWMAWRHTPWEEWTADLRTATGEQKTLALADGTRLTLNTATAVNIAFTSAERRLRLLAGEILVATGKDPSPVPRPFFVATSHGSLRALGTRFTVRRLDGGTRVAVFEGAVEVRPARIGRTAVLHAGEQLTFTAAGLQPALPVDAGAALWESGMLMAQDMRLDELVAELDRYHRGVLRCDPAVAGLLVSGAFPVTRTEASLALLERTLPLRIARNTSWWVTVRAR